MSANGVQQRDPLGLLLFLYLVLHPFIHNIDTIASLFFMLRILMMRSSYEATKSIDIVQVIGLGLSLELNMCKTQIFWSLCDGVSIMGVVLFRNWKVGVGGEVSQMVYYLDKSFIKGLSMKRPVRAIVLMHLLTQLGIHKVDSFYFDPTWILPKRLLVKGYANQFTFRRHVLGFIMSYEGLSKTLWLVEIFSVWTFNGG